MNRLISTEFIMSLSVVFYLRLPVDVSNDLDRFREIVFVRCALHKLFYLCSNGDYETSFRALIC